MIHECDKALVPKILRMVFECNRIKYLIFRKKARNMLLHLKRFYKWNFLFQHASLIIDFQQCFLSAWDNTEIENTISFFIYECQITPSCFDIVGLFHLPVVESVVDDTLGTRVVLKFSSHFVTDLLTGL